ncbi:LysR substrate-binding domain-containing protein [Actinoplanes sp. NBRC 103695]|uniref:LysR substrate-binding domain-containing protein n=1 Tax=Actinoplanes sp. NBRC 103695 TaxID=3032202 RepID=UPI00255327CC|nr:LysR substrate-binding domain-containing protein [Actinoplanes sp. NBRC 103695]
MQRLQYFLSQSTWDPGEVAYDLAVLRPDGVDRPEVDVRLLCTERLGVVLPDHHLAAGRRRLDLARLTGEPFVTHFSGQHSSMHEHVMAACAEASFHPDLVMEVGETATRWRSSWPPDWWWRWSRSRCAAWPWPVSPTSS